MRAYGQVRTYAKTITVCKRRNRKKVYLSRVVNKSSERSKNKVLR